VKEEQKKKGGGGGRGAITTDPLDRKRVIKECYKQLYAHRLENWDEMNQFLERHNLAKLLQEEIVCVGLCKINGISD